MPVICWRQFSDFARLQHPSPTSMLPFFRVKQFLGFDFSSISFKTIPDEVLLFLLNFNSSSSGMSFNRGWSLVFMNFLLKQKATKSTYFLVAIGYYPFILKTFFSIYFFWFLQCLVWLSSWHVQKGVSPNLSRMSVISCSPRNHKLLSPNHQAKIGYRSFLINRREC